MVKEYQQEKPCKAIIRHFDGHCETIQLPRITDGFELIRTVAKEWTPNEQPQHPRYDKFYLKHWSDGLYLYEFESGSKQK